MLVSGVNASRKRDSCALPWRRPSDTAWRKAWRGSFDSRINRFMS
jgi:hypothetical protein